MSECILNSSFKNQKNPNTIGIKMDYLIEWDLT